MKAALFDLSRKKEDQRREEMSRTPRERLLLCLELIDLTIAVSPEKRVPPAPADDVKWIELSFRDNR
mgnify:CR=1 FL=1